MSDFHNQNRGFQHEEKTNLTLVFGVLILALLISGGFYLYGVSKMSGRMAANMASPKLETAPDAPAPNGAAPAR